jgi:hypothetical protein
LKLGAEVTDFGVEGVVGHGSDSTRGRPDNNTAARHLLRAIQEEAATETRKEKEGEVCWLPQDLATFRARDLLNAVREDATSF